MKISPVVGAPTIPNIPNSGNSPEKLARLKAIASGEAPPATEGAEPEEKDKQPTIKMQTKPAPEAMPTEIEQPSTAISDASELTPQAGEKPAEGQPANGTAEATQPLSPQLAALARQRRALQVKEKEIAEREKALSGPTRTDLEARIKSQPLSVLQELGVTYDQLTQDILAAQNGNLPEIQALKAEIKALKEGVDKTLADKDSATEQAVLTQMRRTVDKLCFSGDEYEMIRETKSQPDVIDLIHRTWKETGEVMSEEEAMRLIEEELTQDALKFAKLKKVQKGLTPTEPLQPQAPEAPAPGRQSAMRTLTNKDSAKPAMSRRQRAILAAQGNLKR